MDEPLSSGSRSTENRASGGEEWAPIPSSAIRRGCPTAWATIPDVLTDDDLKARASYRRRTTDCGIGAALGRELKEPDRDGRRWECVVTDSRNFRTIEVLAARVPHDAPILAEQVESLVEDRACIHPLEVRLESLALASPLLVEL